MKTILDTKQLHLSLKRLAHQINENIQDAANTAIIGLQPRGIYVSDKINEEIQQLNPDTKINYGKLDITFYRDDIRDALHIANKTEIDFNIENKTVILIDDVLYTGRTIRAALDALLAFGRPKKVELCVLIDRRFSRELPIQPDYSGRVIDTFITQKVKVNRDENNEISDVILYDK